MAPGANWAGSILAWALRLYGEGTRVRFTHRGMPYDNSNLMLPGWHAYLYHLGARLDGLVPEAFEAQWRRLQDVYGAEYKALHLDELPIQDGSATVERR